MKKITALVAALAIALSLTACGDSSNTSLIGKLIGQGANTNNSSSEKSKTKIDKNTNDVIGDMGSTETFTTAKTEKITVTETSKTESAESGGSTKLADIVGPGVPGRMPAPDIDVNAVLADISREKREELIKDLKYSVGMLEAIHGTTNSLFYDDKRLLGTAYNGYNDSYFYDTYYRTFQDMFYNIRNCFSEDFVSDEEIENITGGINTFVAFGFSPQTIAWEFCPPDPGNPYDFDNAGVVMYSDTEAEVWVAGSAALEATFYVEIFKMVRLDTYGSWKIDKMWIANNGDIDNKWEIGFYY